MNPRCPKARHLGNPVQWGCSLFIPGTWATRPSHKYVIAIMPNPTVKTPPTSKGMNPACSFEYIIVPIAIHRQEDIDRIAPSHFPLLITNKTIRIVNEITERVMAIRPLANAKATTSAMAKASMDTRVFILKSKIDLTLIMILILSSA